jgi:hypothetical protein
MTAQAATERVAELNNKLAVVVLNAELLTETAAPGAGAEQADRALRAAWAAAGVARRLARELRGEAPLVGAGFDARAR